MAGHRLQPHQRELLDQLFDKWSLLVLDVLCEQPARFADLRRALDGITPKSLTATLRRLEVAGVVERIVLSTTPLAVQYSITPTGRTLQEPLTVLLTWVIARADELADSATQSSTAVASTSTSTSGSNR